MASKKEKQRRIKAENKANSTPLDKDAAEKLDLEQEQLGKFLEDLERDIGPVDPEILDEARRIFRGEQQGR